jgi:uncharacterized DUF497 family protein
MADQVHIARLVWDEWNRDHIRKRAVSPEEAEEAITDTPLVRASYKGRLLFTEPTASGRMLTVAAGPVPDQPGAYYIFSARPASRRERAEYQRQGGLST